MSDDVLVKVEGVSKKFCRSLKRSLWYGVQDVASEMLGREGHHDELRKNEFWAVNDVSFELKRGECLGLIGPNGAGKSTLLKMLNGLVKPDKGRITMRGRIGALIELGAGFNPILTARENIYVNGSVLGFSKKEIDGKFDAIVDFAEIEEFIDTPVQNYSSGMKVRLGFAVAAQMDPDVLLIDEVLAVGDFSFQQKCLGKINEMRQKSGLLLVSHSMNTVRMVCDRVIVVDKGGVVCDGDSVSGISCYLERQMERTAAHPSDLSTAGPGVLGQFFWNKQKIANVTHEWSSETYQLGETMELSFSYELKVVPHRLIIGVPIWNESGFCVTALNSDQAGFSTEEVSGAIKGRVKMACHLNSGRYESVLTIVDGNEVLYRQRMPLFRVADKERLFGFVTLPQTWSRNV